MYVYTVHTVTCVLSPVREPRTVPPVVCVPAALPAPHSPAEEQRCTHFQVENLAGQRERDTTLSHVSRF